uniref:NADH dehydrogenase subunit 4L n=1 Tax=Oxyopes hupingensis TaxID=2713554 RepID=A0A6G6D9W7_9ARAC|nr:NADH dehydrogenase subunit 4L [Oxyopes hupingensis]QIE13336.1 NADH dehydrogenase subunit 4L [Oxyopes hupingensis]
MKFIFIMITLSILSMCWWRKNILIMILSLEMLLISLFFHIATNMNLISLPSLMIMLTMMVSGSSMSLSMLISLSNSHKSSNSIFINFLTFVKNYYPSFLNLFK